MQSGDAGVSCLNGRWRRTGQGVREAFAKYQCDWSFTVGPGSFLGSRTNVDGLGAWASQSSKLSIAQRQFGLYGPCWHSESGQCSSLARVGGTHGHNPSVSSWVSCEMS